MFRSRGWCCVVVVLICGPSWAKGPYEPTWESLKTHKAPQWFRDAKFGCWACWCPGVVVTDKVDFTAEWFGRQMYQPKQAAFAHMRKHHGDQKQFGYKDLIPLLKGEKFDAEEWAKLFHRGGAKFAGPLAIFHDNYPLWDSKVTRYDAVDVGPKRDIVGEWRKAVRGCGMKFAATFHHAFAWGFYEPAYAYDAADAKYADLYCQPHKPKTPPTQRYQERWLAMVNEVVNQYEPDLIYFDFGLGKVIAPAYQRRMFADYYNWAATKGVEVGVTHKHRDIHAQTGILDFERGREDRLTPYPWQTDTSVGTWFYHKNSRYTPAGQLVDMLVDIVAKNGCLFLNVPMRADGSIPAPARPIMAGIGDWLKVNGEAIYGTRPWKVFGEGPTRQAKRGGFSERGDRPFTNQDIRFTRSKDGRTMYAIVLGWPEKELTIQSVRIAKAAADARVELLGHDGKVGFKLSDDKQLVIAVPNLSPKQRPCEHAFAFKLTGFDVGLHSSASFDMPGAIRISPEKVVIEGEKAFVQNKGGRPNIGAWDNPQERAHWLVWVRQAGTYAVRGEFSTAYGPSGLTLKIAGQSATAKIPQTTGWFKPIMIGFGELKFEAAGVYHLTLQPADPAAWKTVCVWQIEMAPVVRRNTASGE